MSAVGLLLSVPAAFLLAVLLLPVAVFTVQLLIASVLGAPRRSAAGGTPPPFAVLVPAHNEALGIGATIATLRSQLRPGDRLLVVADNCSDATADVARAAGATVTERFDATRRGKGWALDHGLRQLAADPPSVVLVVDADCEVGEGALQRLAAAAHALGRPVQASYLMRAPAGARLGLRIATFAMIVKNRVRPSGWAWLDLPCQLTGTGMAFPWPVFGTVSLASGHIVEDMKLGCDLALAGTPPWFEPAAHVWSEFPVSDAGAESQRTRWEHGHLQVLTTQAPALVLRGLRRGDLRALALALDLLVPPVALLVMAVVAAAAVAGLGALLGGPAWPAALGAGLVASLAVAVLAGWVRFGRGVVSFGEIVRAPLYALAKIPLYLRYLAGRQTDWVRTRRRGE